MEGEVDVIYNRFGVPEVRVLTNGRLVTFNGRSLGFVTEDNVYNYTGRHMGWYEGGILRDHSGRCVGFGERPTDMPRPFLPFKNFKPFPGFVEFEPFRPFLSFPPFRPFKTSLWSKYSPLGMFQYGRG